MYWISKLVNEQLTCNNDSDDNIYNQKKRRRILIKFVYSHCHTEKDINVILEYFLKISKKTDSKQPTHVCII